MARIRSVHPGLMTDEAFMQLTLDCPLAVALLIGLWMQADDAGTFEWKPLTLKARCLPVAPVRIEELLDTLAGLDFIKRFEVGGRAFGVVRNFVKYQRQRRPTDVHPFTPEMRAYAGFEAGTRPRVGAREADDDDLYEAAAAAAREPDRDRVQGSDRQELSDRREPPRRSPDGPNAPDAPRRTMSVIDRVEEGSRRTMSVKACQRLEVGGKREEVDSSSSSRAPPEIDLSAVRPLGRDPLEAEARLLMDGAPVMVDVDFSPISALLAEPGVTRPDVLAGLADARAAPGFRPVSWRQCVGWVRKAAKNRIGAEMAAPGARAPPRGRPDIPTRSTSASLSRMAQDGFDFAALAGARDGPVLDGDLAASA